MSRFSHNDMSEKGTSYVRKYTKLIVRRYKAKHACDNNTINADQTFCIFYFLYVFVFLTQK